MRLPLSTRPTVRVCSAGLVRRFSGAVVQSLPVGRGAAPARGERWLGGEMRAARPSRAAAMLWETRVPPSTRLADADAEAEAEVRPGDAAPLSTTPAATASAVATTAITTIRRSFCGRRTVEGSRL